MANSAAFSISIVGNTALATAAAGLVAGSGSVSTSWTNFGGVPAWDDADQITWQTSTLYWDATRKELHAAGKSAGTAAGVYYEHFIYSEASNSWGARTLAINNAAGHMWCTTFDPATGEYYFAQNGRSPIRRYAPGSGWTTIANCPGEGGTWTYIAGLGWHPNLYGTGDGGLVAVGGTATYAWRKSTGLWATIQTGQTTAASGAGGSGAYDAANNKVWVGTGAGNRASIVTGGSAGAIGAAVSVTSAPIAVYGAGEGGTVGKVIVHPGDATKLMLLGANSTGGSAVYISTNSGSTWASAGYTHPFNLGSGQWTCGSVPTHGIVWAMSSRDSLSRIWKPPVT